MRASMRMSMIIVIGVLSIPETKKIIRMKEINWIDNKDRALPFISFIASLPIGTAN
jgi:hypothetical protein